MCITSLALQIHPLYHFKDNLWSSRTRKAGKRATSAPDSVPSGELVDDVSDQEEGQAKQNQLGGRSQGQDLAAEDSRGQHRELACVGGLFGCHRVVTTRTSSFPR